MAEYEQQPIFSLDSEESPYIEIDGTAYHLISVSQLGIRDQTMLKRQSARLAELFRAEGEPSEDEIAEIENLIDSQFRLIMPDCPDAVARKLGDWNKQRIVDAFFRAELGRMQGEAAQGSESGDTSSPDASDSTAAASASG